MKKNIIITAALLTLAACSGINTPDRVEVIAEDGSITLARQHGSSFTAGDVTVSFTEKDGGLAASLRAPDSKVKFVKAYWDGLTGKDAMYLGDHWERSYGDLGWRRLADTRTMPWYFLEVTQPQGVLQGGGHTRGHIQGNANGQIIKGYGVQTGCNSFCSWNVDEEGICLTMDVRNGTHGICLGERELEMATVIFFDAERGESAFDALHRFCKVMCPSPRLPEKPIYGINDWEYAYGNNSEEQVASTAELISEFIPEGGNVPYFVIDDGWALYSNQDDPGFEGRGGFLESNEKFPDMKRMAGRIRRAGFKPGLWMRPLCAWKGCDESLLMTKYDPDSEDRYFDPTVPEVREYIRRCFETYHEWGYEMVKHDFTTFDIFQRWGGNMLREGDLTWGDWQFHDTTLTNAEVILQLYRDIREAAGDIYIIGCNTVSHLSAGIFELQRTGNDTSGREWGSNPRNGVNTLAFRAAQHNAFYAIDADCTAITKALDWDLAKQWLELVAYSGTPLFIAPEAAAMGEEQCEAVRKAFEVAAAENPIAEPLDWFETDRPAKWMLCGEEVEFHWNR